MQNPLIEAMQRLLRDRIIDQPMTEEREQAIDELAILIRRLSRSGTRDGEDWKIRQIPEGE